jgi:hypothetical protein
MNLPDKLDAYASQLTLARKFVGEYGHHFQDEKESYFPPLDVILFPEARFTVRKDFCAKAGEIFGCDGWVRVKAGLDDTYSWSKRVDGVLVTIEYCEDAPTMNGTPVPVKAFPIQLTQS